MAVRGLPAAYIMHKYDGRPPRIVLDRLRKRLGSALVGLGDGAARVLPSPNAWTFAGFMASLLAAYSYALGGPGYPIAAGALVLLSGFFDVVDGAVARSTGRVSKRGSFLDSTLDRVGETALYVGILLGGYAPAVWVLAALAFSLLVSYVRAKGDSLGVSLAGIGVGERSERLIVLAVVSILGAVYVGVVLVAVLAAATFVQRTYKVSRSLK